MLLVLTCAIACELADGPATADIDLQQAIQTIRKVGPNGNGSPDASRAWRKVAGADVSRLGQILAGMDGANSLARNWLRSALDEILERARKDVVVLPQKTLEAFLADQKHDAQARRLAYELLADMDKTIPDRFLPQMLDDPSPDLRRDAINRAFDDAEKLARAGSTADALTLHRKVFAAARERSQIDRSVQRLRLLGEKVDLARHLGLVLDWKLAGPFPNEQQKGMSAVYPPEQKIDLQAEYQGKTGKIRWIAYYSTDDYGLVDLNKALGKHQEAVAYACTDFTTRQAQDAELRIGCATAFKVWLNSELVLERGDAYTGMSLDHYLARVHLRKDNNVLLLKIAQDTPPPQVAALWQFQLRACDPSGAAILSATRPGGPPSEERSTAKPEQGSSK
jgi:hypothetical protein